DVLRLRHAVAEALVEFAGALALDVAADAHAIQAALPCPTLRCTDELRSHSPAARGLLHDQRADLGPRIVLQGHGDADVDDPDGPISIDGDEHAVHRRIREAGEAAGCV